jgi:hypothetical protein
MLCILARLAMQGEAGLRRRGPHTAFWYPDRR